MSDWDITLGLLGTDDLRAGWWQGAQVRIKGLSLAKGSANIKSTLELTYTSSPVSLADLRGNDMGHEGLDLGTIDCNSDGKVTSNELLTFAKDVTSKAALGNLDATDVFAALDAARFDTISKANFSNPLPSFTSETAVFTVMQGDVKSSPGEDFLLSVEASRGQPLGQDSPFLFQDFQPAARPERAEDFFLVDLLRDQDIEGLVFADDERYPPLDETPVDPQYPRISGIPDTMEGIMDDLDVGKEFDARLAEIDSQEEYEEFMRQLLAGQNVLPDKKQGGKLPRYLVRCCVKMYDPVSGDEWPEYEVLGVRRIRKRVNVKGKCKCEKYYRLECKKGRDNSTRTGEFVGRVHIECQYMDMVDVVKAIGDRMGWS